MRRHLLTYSIDQTNKTAHTNNWVLHIYKKINNNGIKFI